MSTYPQNSSKLKYIHSVLAIRLLFLSYKELDREIIAKSSQFRDLAIKMKTATTTLILFLSFTIWYLSAIPRYYRLARKTGLPLYFTPVNPSNPLWLIIVSVLGYDAIARFMPKLLFDRVKLTIPGWEYRCKYTMNHRLGVNFVLVSPGCNTIFIGDPDLGNTILIRRKEFGRIEVAARTLNLL